MKYDICINTPVSRYMIFTGVHSSSLHDNDGDSPLIAKLGTLSIYVLRMEFFCDIVLVRGGRHAAGLAT